MKSRLYGPSHTEQEHKSQIRDRSRLGHEVKKGFKDLNRGLSLRIRDSGKAMKQRPEETLQDEREAGVEETDPDREQLRRVKRDTNAQRVR